MIEFLTALSLCLLNMVSFFFFYNIAINREAKYFLRIIFLSMALRYIINLFALWIFLDIFEFDKLIFSLTFLISTFILIIFEIFYLNYQSKYLKKTQ